MWMKIKNESNTEEVVSRFFVDDPPPRNPLVEKWNTKYPPEPKPEYSQVCDGYSCMWCSRCPAGEYWKCPEEDLDVYRKYVGEVENWKERHPKWMDKMFLEVNT